MLPRTTTVRSSDPDRIRSRPALIVSPLIVQAGEVFNFLSAKNISINIGFEAADFRWSKATTLCDCM